MMQIRMTHPVRATLAAVALLAAACGAPPATTPSPALPEPGAGVPPGAAPDVAGPREPEDRLPPIPAVDGPLQLRVSYPRDSMRVGTRGRNFIFGSVGSGQARLWIEGAEVEVQPNGAFLAFLPVPADGVYRLRATLRGDSASLRVPVRLPEPEPAADTALIVPGSVFPTGAWAALPDERIVAGFRGTAGGLAWLEFADGSRVTLLEETGSGPAGATDFEVNPGAEPAGATTGLARYRGFFRARRVVSADTAVAWPALAVESRPGPRAREAAAREGARERAAGAPPPLGMPAGGGAEEAGAAGTDARREAAERGGPATLVLAVAGDTVRRPLALNLVLADPHRPRVGAAYDADPPESNGDEHITARPDAAGGPYHYTWRNGTELELTGERNGSYRVRLADGLSAWTPADDVTLHPPGRVPPESGVGAVRLDPRPRHIDVHVALDRRLPYRVETRERSVTVWVFGARSRVNFLQHGRVDAYIERAEWSQPSDRVFRLDLHLASRPWGHETLWGPGDDLVLRLRRPPAIDPDHPLRGLTVGVDAGHGGADRFTMGPTGLTEADANLGIARALRDALERRGARVVMSRTSDSTVSLVERTRFAREQDVDLWVSTHNNAFPDGVNPWENNGTSVYYNHAPSADLAWAVHRELLAELGLRDIGVGRADLHMARFTWSPAILTETAFMMIPEQEAFLMTEAGQRRIAEAHARGFEDWLRTMAAGR